jgi:hypothetical protein
VKLSEDKVTHLSHVVLKGLIEKDLIIPRQDEGKLRKAIKLVIAGELKIGEAIDEAVRRKLESFSRKIIEGSPEWEVLYRKFYREEEVKKGRQ